MNSSFNVNQYWLERGKTYMQETRTPAEFHRLQERFLLHVLQESGIPLQRILEIGCGFGRITRLLGQTWPQAQITAVDLSPEQLDNARRYCADCPQVSFEQFDFYSGAPFPGERFDAAVAIEVFLHHPPEFLESFLKRLSGVAAAIVSIDWSEQWSGVLPEHVWLHDYPKLFRAAGLECARFALPGKVDGKQQKLFVATREISATLRTLERDLQPREADGAPPAGENDGWDARLRSATSELLRIVPRTASVILVDDGQWGNVRAFSDYRIFPFRERNGLNWGPPENDEDAWRELERLKRAGAAFIAFAWPSFWWFDHYKDFSQRLRATFPCLLENDQLVVFKLTN